MLKSLVMVVTLVMSAAVNAGLALDTYFSGSYFKDMSAQCPNVKITKVLAEYRSRVEAANGRIVGTRTKEEKEAALAYDDACKAVIEKKTKK